MFGAAPPRLPGLARTDGDGGAGQLRGAGFDGAHHCSHVLVPVPQGNGVVVQLQAQVEGMQECEALLQQRECCFYSCVR